MDTDRIEMAEERDERTLDSMFAVLFGTDIDLTDTSAGITLRTDEFPRD
ncbi:hypothetical protein ACNPQM_18895 [Streptomyces sp. NPDC056231]